MKEQDWDIKARDEACRKCEKPFGDGDNVFSKLTFGEEGYVRNDFCKSCWEKEDKQDALSVWCGEFRLPPPPPDETLKKETAESLLRRLIEQEDSTSGNTIFILAVMLERRRIFDEKDVQIRKDGVKVRVYEHKKTGEVFLVPDPELRLAELEHVQEEVVIMLGGKPRAKEEPDVEEPEVEENEDDEERDE